MGDWDDKLNAILSSPETMEQIAALASSLSGNSAEQPPSEAPAPPPAEGLSALLGGIDPELIGKLMPLLREYQSGGGEQAALLNALRPFVREESQQKLDKALRITRLSKVIRASMSLLGGSGHV